MEISKEVDSNELLSRDNIRLLLLVLAFITPYVICFIPVLGVYYIRLEAPLWMSYTKSDNIFEFWSLSTLIMALPFGLIRLAFIQQVLLYKKNLTDSGKLVIVGICCELPYSILCYVLGVSDLGLPFPLFLVVGLIFAKYTTKEPLSWIEKESNAH